MAPTYTPHGDLAQALHTGASSGLGLCPKIDHAMPGSLEFTANWGHCTGTFIYVYQIREILLHALLGLECQEEETLLSASPPPASLYLLRVHFGNAVGPLIRISGSSCGPLHATWPLLADPSRGPRHPRGAAHMNGIL